MSINSLPHVSQQQMRETERIAAERMKRDGIILEDVQTESIDNKHPMLAHHEDPSMQIEPDDSNLHGQDQIIEQEQYSVQEEQQQESEPVETIESVKAMNYRMMREAKERAERERDEAMKYAMSFQQQKQKQVEPEVEEDYLSGLGIDNDGLAEGKHLRQVLKEVRELKKELNSYKSKSTLDHVEVRLKTQYPDFDNVVTKDNIDTLASINPDLAEMIHNTPDMYKKAKIAYDMVKQLGIYKDRSFDNEKVVAHKNAAKPRPLASVSPQQGDTPLSKANAFANGPLSKEIKNQHYKEMLEAMKGR
jgi:hypothetical protein